jgi:hypothetical protein
VQKVSSHFTPKDRHIRETDDRDSPVSAAIVLVAQWLSCPGPHSTLRRVTEHVKRVNAYYFLCYAAAIRWHAREGRLTGMTTGRVRT